MIERIWKFLALNWRLKALFLEAFCLTGIFRYSLGTKPFKELASGLKLDRETRPVMTHSPDSLEVARQIGWVVRATANFTPWSTSCLVQVLTAQRMLQKRNISGAFYLGVLQPGSEDEQPALEAHAWLKCHDECITGESRHERFTVVSSFSWS